jgi:phosphoribosyl 1,2-cyclic phosphodiesterase
MTDLGHVFKDLVHLVASLDAVFLESNYDPEMLADGPYPAYLKQRIKGPHGHISNREAAEVLLRATEENRLQWACLAHLSEQNNHPDVALRTHREVMAEKLTLTWLTATGHRHSYDSISLRSIVKSGLGTGARSHLH